MVKYYAVRKGRETGIFTAWSQVKPLINGFSGAQHKSFTNIDSAQSYLMSDGTSSPLSTSPNISVPSPDGLRRSFDGLNTASADSENNSFEGQYDVIIYTDGSANQEGGGYGVVFSKDNTAISTFKGQLPIDQYPKPTNNQAELYAILIALQESSEYQKILIRSDSSYSINCLTKWCYNWIDNGWKTSQGNDVLNKELIVSIMDKMAESSHIVEFNHVPGHNGIAFNEMADRLANEGRLE